MSDLIHNNDDAVSTLKRKVEDMNINEDQARSPKRRYATGAETSCSGLDQNKFVTVNIEFSHLICTACGRLSLVPCMLPCGHVVCKRAVEACEEKGQTTITCYVSDCQDKREFPLSDCKEDKALKKAINKLQVHCKNEGCQVTPSLKLLQDHLETACDFALVKCKKCLQEFLRKEVQAHESGCTSQVCVFHSVGCGHVSTERTTGAQDEKHIGTHVASLYTLTADFSEMVSATHSNVQNLIMTLQSQRSAFDQIVRRLEKPLEGEEEVKKALVTKRTAEEVTKRVEDMTGKIKDILHIRMPALAERQLQQTRQSQYMDHLDEARSKRDEEVLTQIRHLPFNHNYKKIIFKVSNFSVERAKAIQGNIKRVHGPRFYAAQFSYLLCPMIYPNGDGPGAGSHVSVFIAICKGPYDALLRWPMMARITFVILPQKPNVEQIRHTFRSDVASPSYSRPKTEMNAASGIPRTMSLDLLKQPSNFLVDDTLFIQVEVDLLQ